MKYTKSANDMELKELRKIILISTISLMVFAHFFNWVIIQENLAFVWIAKSLTYCSIILTTCILLCIFSNKLVLIASYIGTAINGSITMLSLYLLTTSRSGLTSVLSQIIVLGNFVLIAVVLIVKRIVIKNKNYIESIKRGNHGKYVKRDAIFALITSSIFLSFAKIIDINQSELPIEKPIAGIILMAASLIGLSAYITSIANYVYTQRGRMKKDNY